jgi:2-polyprenyl-3-methyl-5-hydroxy-6-metoxy-1,4-benzoquinol methylase
MEHVSCPLCGSSEYKILFARSDHTHGTTPEQFFVVRCRSCSFVFVNPRPSFSEIGSYYPREFYDTEKNAEQLLKDKEGTLDGRLALVGNLPPGRLLDIGCQKGEFMYVMSKRGWDVQGVEFSETPPNVFRLPIFCGRLEDASFAPESFDLITLWAILEHVHDPISLLKGVRRVLKPTGRSFILVPNFNSIPGRFMRHDDVPRHLLMFTKRTLRYAAALAGLRVKRYVFGDDIFSGSTRGVLNYLWKLAHGEPLEKIVAQNRTPGRWLEFASYLNGEENSLMLAVDRIDIRLTPYLDWLVNRVGFGFIMTAEVVPEA